MPIPYRTALQSQFIIQPEKTKTFAAGTNTLKVVALGTNSPKTINFILADLDTTAVSSLVVYAASAADGTGTLIEMIRKSTLNAANQTAVIEVDSSYIAGFCDKSSGGITPLSVVLKIESAALNDSCALCTIIEPTQQALGNTPSSIA